MKKNILSLITILLISLFAFGFNYGTFYFSDATKYVNVEKTGSGAQVIIPGESGLSIVMKSYCLFIKNSGKVYFYQGTDPTKKVLLPPIDHDGNFGRDRDYNALDLNKNALYALDEGNSLMMWTSTDPDEGWFEGEFEKVKVQ